MPFTPKNHLLAAQKRAFIEHRNALLAEQETVDDYSEELQEEVIALQCYASNFQYRGDLPEQIVYLPIGATFISAGTVGGGTFSGAVIVDEDAFNNIQAAFSKMQTLGQRAWLDFDHEGKDSAGEITGFDWDPERGILARVSWSGAGESAIRHKNYSSFSPSFLASKDTGKIHGLATASGMAAGALVNNPAFGRSMPGILSESLSLNK